MEADEIDVGALTRELVRPDSRWRQVDVVPETGSTNADLAARARAGEPVGAVLVTEAQTVGRGRQGRSWTAPAGGSIAMSVLVRPEGIDPSRWTWLPLLAGLAVTDGIRQGFDLPAELKWPNDVLIGERKVCGILAERVDTPDGPACVVGMGINVSLTEEQLPVPTATSLALAAAELGAAGLVIPRTTLITHVLVSLDRILRHWSTVDNDTAVSVAYRERCTTLGRHVRVLLAGDRSVEGVAESVDPAGRLVVTTPAGPQTFSAADVIHLR